MQEPIPWHTIKKQWRNGSPLDALSLRFNVPLQVLKHHLSTAYDSERLDIRSNKEISDISLQVKSDLVTSLARLSQQLAHQPDISLRDAPTLDRLISSAARLFAWPNPKPVDSPANTLLANTNAINLALIRTTPDQLKALADNNILRTTQPFPSQSNLNSCGTEDFSSVTHVDQK